MQTLFCLLLLCLPLTPFGLLFGLLLRLSLTLFGLLLCLLLTLIGPLLLRLSLTLFDLLLRLPLSLHHLVLFFWIADLILHAEACLDPTET